MMNKTIAIGKLFNDILESGNEIVEKGDYEIIVLKREIKIQTLGNKYVGLKAISRHKTKKHLVEIVVRSGLKNETMTITTDHVCMILNRDHFFENVNAKNLRIGDYVSVYDEETDSEKVGTIEKVKDIGETEEYVYDCEVDDDIHAFYCENVLIHNSQFISIKCITDEWINRLNLPKNLNDWSDEKKLELWKSMEEFVENTLNPYVQNLVKEWCHTEHPEVLTYALEYMGDNGIYESKKHYAVRKIVSEGPELVDKIKYSGIELKKASIPKSIKKFLGEIYKNTLTNNWTDSDFRNYLNTIYPEFEKMDIEDIAIWKGYNTPRSSTGFLQMEKGATGISKACVYYSQLLQEMKIGDKYDDILIGDKVKVCYIKPTNKYGINIIAFKDGKYPEEFRKTFDVDYETMWEKLIVSPLKNFRAACRFTNTNPNEANLMDPDDL